MRVDPSHKPYRVVLITLDKHAAKPVHVARQRIGLEFPYVEISIHAASEWEREPEALERARLAVAQADMIITAIVFLESHVNAILPDIQARRSECDCVVGLISDQSLVKCTQMGSLDMQRPASTVMGLLKKLRGDTSSAKRMSGESQMKMLRRLPKLLKLIPGKAQDLRAWFLCMQYWLGGSEDNIEQMIRFLLGRYATCPDLKKVSSEAPIEYPEMGVYHPDIEGRGIATSKGALPDRGDVKGTVGVIMLRSYILAGDTAHYDAVIRQIEAQNLRVLPVFAGGLDARPAIEAYLSNDVDLILSLTGFSLVGGPAYNDSEAAVACLQKLNVPYLAAQPLEFQTLGQWAEGKQGLGPIETTMLVALPEMDGATNPTVFAGRHGVDGCRGCPQACKGDVQHQAMAPCHERIEILVQKVVRLVELRHIPRKDKKLSIILYGFPPNSGAVGSAAYLSVFESLWAVMKRLGLNGYHVECPESVDELREHILGGNAKEFGQVANVAASITAQQLVSELDYLEEIEAVWGAAPGKFQTDGRQIFMLGAEFGNLFVGVQPAFGVEGDPMKLLFEGSYAPTHAFAGFYHWIKNIHKSHAILHFGMHGALEFMPGRQVGMGPGDWPDRLIGDLPHIYLYAANNPSEAALAKRRANAVIITHLTPPLTASGLYRGLQDLKDSLAQYRTLPPTDERKDSLWALIKDQAEAVDLPSDDRDLLWRLVLETEQTLVPEGLHILGKKLSPKQTAQYTDHLPQQLQKSAEESLMLDSEIPSLLRAMEGEYIAPVPGGDIIRRPEVLPTGRNIHAFDPFRMPTSYAVKEGQAQARLLLETHDVVPSCLAIVLWGSDNIKSDGMAIAQALALMGARPRFDHYGRLSGADLIPLEELGRPRVDVVMTLSGIFRDLLPLQSRMLAEAALKAATANEPLGLNHIRAHALEYMQKTGGCMQEASMRVFSNAEGVYGSNVNQLVDGSAFEDEDELADAYEARKGFAYDMHGNVSAQPKLLQHMLAKVELAYQNLESAELGVTTIDHYFDTLGGVARAVKRARGGGGPAVYIGDQTTGQAKVRTLKDQVALETRTRSLNPKFYEAMLRHGHEGVRNIEAHITNTMGLSATTGDVEPWVYQRLSETFMLDPEMRARLSALNPEASVRMANRLIEASDRSYWHPDPETLEALQGAANELEDELEGVNDSSQYVAQSVA